MTSHSWSVPLLIGISAIALFGSLAALGVYLAIRGSTYHDTIYNRMYSQERHTLGCAGHPHAYDARTGAPTDLCLFTGDYSTGLGVDELSVRNLCSQRDDCAAYQVSQTVQPGQSDNHNNGQPEYRLLSAHALAELTDIPPHQAGAFHNTRTRIEVRA